jgi:hypothetical protein
MRLRVFLSLLFLMNHVAATVSAADLTEIARTIAKEPAYKHKPKYCLLVFGPEAKGRAWLVLDGPTLYVDRNGNGDLTEAGERIQEVQSESGTAFRAGDLSFPGDKSLCQNLFVYRFGVLGADRELLGLSITIDGKTWRARTREFSDRPSDAPIIHLNGRLTLLCSDGQVTFSPGKTTHLFVYTGTSGLGEGRFAWRKAAEVVAPRRWVEARIVFPSKNPDGEPIRTTVSLPLDDCCGSAFVGPVQAPAWAGLGKARVTLVPEERTPSLSPNTLFIPVVRAEPAKVP